MKRTIRFFALILIIISSTGIISGMVIFADSAETASNDTSSNSTLSSWERRPTPDKYNFPPTFGLQTSAQITGGPDDFGYTWAEDGAGSCSYNFIDIATTGIRIPLNDDEVSPPIPINFPFPYYYGLSYTDAYISSNGFISFDSSISSGCCSGQTISSATTPNNIISLFWEDLNPSGLTPPDGIFYQTVGTAPNRTFIVQYNNVPHFPNGPNVTAQIQLHESTGEIHLVYEDAPFQVDGVFTSIGIENQNGTDGLNYYYGDTGPIADQVCFIPPEEIPITIEKTLGLNGQCTTDNLIAPANSQVTYCFEITNNSTVTYNYHTIGDDHLGLIADNSQITVPPGGSTNVVVGPVTVTTDTVNTVIWEACLDNPLPVAPPEPEGDAEGIHDITNVAITSDTNVMTMTISFADPIAPAGSGLPQSLFGFFELDIDPGSGNGTPSDSEFFCPESHDILFDYYINFYASPLLVNPTGTVLMVDDFANPVGLVGYEFNSPDFILTFDLNIFNIDPNTVEYSLAFGDSALPTDCANNTPVTTNAQCTAYVDEAVFTVGEPLDVNLSQLQTNSRSSLIPVIVLTNLILLTLITLYHRRRKA